MKRRPRLFSQARCRRGSRTYGDGTAEVIDHVVQKLIDDAFQAARSILEREQDFS